MNDALLFYEGRPVHEPAEKEIILNRSLMYGDGFFESMRCTTDGIAFADQHQQRVLHAASLLQLEPSSLPGIKNIEKLILPQTSKGINYRLRLTVFRRGAGFYAPEGNQASYILQLSPFQPVQQNLHIDIYPEQQKAPGPLSQIKSTSALLYVMAAIYGNKNNLDECLVLNTNNRLAESTSSNVFIVHNNAILTPPLSEGCVAGVYRSVMIDKLTENNYALQQQPVTLTMLSEASEIWLSNTVRGLRCAHTYAGRNLESKLFESVTKLL